MGDYHGFIVEYGVLSAAALPMWLKYLVLMLAVLELMGGCFFLRRWWLERHGYVPIAASFAMLLCMFSLYLLLGAILFFSCVPRARGPMLYWLFVFSLPLVLQYALNLSSSITLFFTGRLSPVGVEIPPPPALTSARRQLLSGNTERAMKMFTECYAKRSVALMEAARLLRQEGRMTEAGELLGEVVRDCREDGPQWAEAVYLLGKLYETEWHQPKWAMELYRRLLNEMPDSRNCHLAAADLARLQIMDPEFLASLNDDGESSAASDPFLPKGVSAGKRKGTTQKEQAPSAKSRTATKQTGKPTQRAGKAQTTATDRKKTISRKKQGENAAVPVAQTGNGRLKKAKLPEASTDKSPVRSSRDTSGKGTAGESAKVAPIKEQKKTASAAKAGKQAEQTAPSTLAARPDATIVRPATRH